MDQGKIMTKYVLKVQLNIPPQYPTIYSAHLSKLDNYLKKKPHHMSTVCTHLLPTILKICMGPHFITKCTKIEKKSPLLISLIHK